MQRLPQGLLDERGTLHMRPPSWLLHERMPHPKRQVSPRAEWKGH